MNAGSSSDRADAGNGDSRISAPHAAANSARPAYEELFNSFADAVFVLDESGGFLYVNDAGVVMSGHPKAFFTGNSYEAITAAGPNDPRALLRRFKKALAGEPQSVEFRGMRANGEQFLMDLRLAPTRCDGQRVIVIVARDVTRQKQVELQVHRLNRLYAVLNATNEFIVRCHDARTLFDEACRIAVEAGGFRMTWIGLTDTLSEKVTPVAHCGQIGDYLEHLHIARTNDARGSGPTGEALRKGKFTVCNDIANDPRMIPWREHALRMGYCASAAFPLLVAGELRGVLSLYADTAGFFDTGEIALLERLAQNISFALEVSEVESRRVANEAHMQWDREQQATLRGMLEAVLKGGTLEETLDYCLKQVLTVSWLSILPKGGIFLMEENRNTLRLTVSRDLSKEIMSLCNRVPLGKCHCGRAAATRQIQFSHCVDERHEISYPGMAEHGHYNMPLISEGEVLGVMVLYLPHGFQREPQKEQFLSSVTDILAGFVRRKRHEESLRLSAAVIESTHDAVMVTDLNRTILSVNPSFTDITGYTEAEVLGQTPKVLNSQRHDALFYQQMWKSIGECGYWQGEIWNRRKNGELYPEWLSLSTVRDEKGRVVNYVGVFSDISKVKQVEEKLERLAHYDALTDLPNRLLLQSRLKHAIEQARRDHRNLAVLFLDLDRFKRVNDSLGHPAGDELLQTVARRLLGRLREVDTLARLGGDEFVILLESLQDVQDAANIAHSMIELIKEPIYLGGGREVYVGASVGISIFPEDGTTAEQLIRNADTAMYQAKGNNRGGFHLYTEAMTRRVEQRLDMEARLRHALSHDELVLHYQPLISVENSRCKGVEALVRWDDPLEGSLVYPGKFIPLAEETGMILPLGDWVLRTACRQMKAWLDSGLALEMLAINLSPAQFKQPDIHERIAACLAETGLPPSCLELEITETAIMEQGSGAVVKLAELKQLGVRIAIDDFGTGYSSLSYLKDFSIDKLKIDQSFVRDVHTSPAAAEIAAIIITMARTLKLESLAEGVELHEQLQFLKSRGCDSCQGFLFSRPMPADSIPRVLKRESKGLVVQAGAPPDKVLI